ncbi:hypothetical protein SALBM135S_08441 [Streptomyces alboniger]
MKAIVQDAYGSADLLRLREIDRPRPRDDEVLVEIRAAGLGPEVWHLMTGRPWWRAPSSGFASPGTRCGAGTARGGSRPSGRR